MEKSNKLIAEFMGMGMNKEKTIYLNSESVIDIGYSRSLSELEFNQSWDWLIPVKAKILELDTCIDNVRYRNDDPFENCGNHLSLIYQAWDEVDFKKMYKSIVDYIKSFKEEAKELSKDYDKAANTIAILRSTYGDIKIDSSPDLEQVFCDLELIINKKL